MTREQQAKKDCAIIVPLDMEYCTQVSIAYSKGLETGIKWADSHPNWRKYPEDRPPEEDDQNYLVINKIGVYTVAEYVDNQDGQGYHFHDLLDPEGIYDDSIKDQDVVTWMQLPEPPEFVYT